MTRVPPEATSLRTIGRAVRVAAVLLAGLGLVAACGSSDRPEDLSLSEANPCRLVPSPRLEALEVIRGPTLIDDAGGYGMEGSGCKYYVVYGRDAPQPGTQPNSNTVKLSVVTNHGVGWKVDETSDGDDAKFKDVRRIEGFSTVRIWDNVHPAGPNTYCVLYVDVADETFLALIMTSVRGRGRPRAGSLARRCTHSARSKGDLSQSLFRSSAQKTACPGHYVNL